MKRNKSKRVRCEATVRNGVRTGEQCTKWAVEGRRFCKDHGGTGGRPPTTGRQSRYVCEALGDSINKFRNDPDIKCIRDEIAVLRALLENAMTRITEEPASLLLFAPALEELCNNIGKQVERLVKIEDGLKLTVSVVDIHTMVNQVVEILTQEIDDEDALAKIKKRLQGLMYSGA